MDAVVELFDSLSDFVVDEPPHRVSKDVSVKSEQHSRSSTMSTLMSDKPTVKPEPGDWGRGTRRRTLSTDTNDQGKYPDTIPHFSFGLTRMVSETVP